MALDHQYRERLVSLADQSGSFVEDSRHPAVTSFQFGTLKALQGKFILFPPCRVIVLIGSSPLLSPPTFVTRDLTLYIR